MTQKTKTIIGIVGSIGAGKDTSADYLTNFHSFRRESFATSLKDAVAMIFGWDRSLLEGRTKQSREWREQPDEWWATRLGMPHLTPRWVLQYFGTDVCRMAFHDDIWIASLERKLLTSEDNIVISDCRFPNEFKAIQNAGGKIIRVRRGDDPEWFSVAKIINRGLENEYLLAHYKSLMDSYNIHSSEWSWVGLDFSHVLKNDGTIDQLYQQINDIII